MAIFTDKRSHLDAYKERKQPELDAILASLPRGQVEIFPALKEWFEPILELADQTCPRHRRHAPARTRRRRPDRDRLRQPRGPRVGRRIPQPLRLPYPPRAGRVLHHQPRGRLGELHLPLLPVRGRAEGHLQRVPLQLLQVPLDRADRVRRGLLRRAAPRAADVRMRRLHDPAPLPAPEGRPRALRRGGGRHPHLHPARLAVRARNRQVPDQRRQEALLEEDRARTRPDRNRRWYATDANLASASACTTSASSSAISMPPPRTTPASASPAANASTFPNRASSPSSTTPDLATWS